MEGCQTLSPNLEAANTEAEAAPLGLSAAVGHPLVRSVRNFWLCMDIKAAVDQLNGRPTLSSQDIILEAQRLLHGGHSQWPTVPRRCRQQQSGYLDAPVFLGTKLPEVLPIMLQLSDSRGGTLLASSLHGQPLATSPLLTSVSDTCRPGAEPTLPQNTSYNVPPGSIVNFSCK